MVLVDVGQGKYDYFWGRKKTGVKMNFIWMFLLAVSISFAEVTTEFAGLPKVQSIAVGVNAGVFKKLGSDESEKYKCIISNIDGKYYWASRENKEVKKKVSGLYIIYIAVEGSGFIKILNKEFKESPNWQAMSKMLTDTETNFDYVEVLHTGLKTVTYFGINN